MRVIFADTLYWVAVLDARDPWHGTAVRVSKSLGDFHTLTTDLILVEVLNTFSASGPVARRGAMRFVRDLFTRPDSQVIPQDRPLLQAGLDLYDRRPDKGYSLTDCISMHVMRERGLREVLTNDRHFAQEGFDVLIPSR